MSWLAALPLIGGVMNAGGQWQEDAQTAASLENEAQVAEQNALQAKAVGLYNARRQELEAGQRLGALKAEVGASGIDSDSGNVLDILRQSAVNAELDRQNILRGADLQARGLRYEAEQARFGAKQVKKNRVRNAITTMFGAGAKSYERGWGGTGNGKIASTDTGYSGQTMADTDRSYLSNEFRNGNLKADSYYA